MDGGDDGDNTTTTSPQPCVEEETVYTCAICVQVIEKCINSWLIKVIILV